MDRILLCVILLLVQCYMPSFANASIPNITTDQSALLALKIRISPHNILTNNWSTHTSVCNWVGVTCGSRHHRVTALNLSYMGLAGTIPPHIGNLSFLVSLRIINNSFYGSMPNELARLYRLKRLNFGFNNFNGEIPSSMGLLSKLQYLLLYGNSFTGTIPPSLSNISSLQRIGLAFNRLSGFIPSSIFNISTLQQIDLGENELSGSMPSIFFNMPSLQHIDLYSNKLSGRIPTDMFDHFPNLQWLQLSRNQFYGELPPALFKCKQLQYLSLRANNFGGRVPPEIGNLTMVKTLYLAENNFAGAIPNEIGYLQNLEKFNIGDNNFSGPIPFEIFNISTLQFIGMPLNKISGNIPSNIGLFLPNLQQLLLGGNKLNGTIPSSISKASQLIYLDLSKNSFSGLIPKTIGNLSLLQYLNLEYNNLTIESQEMNSLFSSLSNCIYLEILSLTDNPLNGILPSSIGNLSSLQEIFMGGCNIKGNIFKDIGNLSSLTILELGDNKLVGSIPTEVDRLGMLQGLYLGNNRLQGPIPSNLCHLKGLFELYLSGNELDGQILGCINNLTFLRNLYLGFNKLTSTIPLSLWSLEDLLEVDLSSNSLSGSLSLEIGNLKVLRILDLSRNRLSSDIPITIGNLENLVRLSLAGNRLEGSIPDSFAELVSLELLDLSSNNLSGEIPKSLEALVYLKYLNVSFNRLRGEIPTRGPFIHFSAASFMSNDALCGVAQLQVPPCKGASRSKKTKTRHILKLVLPITIGSTILVVSLVLVLRKRQKRKTKFSGKVDLSPLATWRRISHQELLQATEGFNPNNLLGEGSFGSVYKGTLLDGMNVAIKVLNLQIEGAFRSFDVECEVLRNIRHRNLVKIITACSNVDFKAFVLEYMPNGNLEMWLYSGNYHLNMLQRLNIMIDVATALEYLHFGYSTPIVHCDLKPNNILLDEDMVAHVADFGIAKLLGDGDSIIRTMTLATIGYMAPEYGSEGIISTKGDVYSYGILLMETFTRKKPTDDMFVEEMSLKHWVEESLALSIMEIMDANLLGSQRYYAAMKDCTSSIMELALDCCADSPEERINTKTIPVTLNKIKSKLLQDLERA